MAAIASINNFGKYALNPRGNLWLNDENKFGLKMLSKMGWKQGKGLGKNEDGILENLKVKVKGSNSGVGWKEKMSSNFQSEEYETLLNSLKEGYSSFEKDASEECQNEENGGLEYRSQKFRNRLHYRKFIRGKDVSKYSEKDMKSIFVLKNNSEDLTSLLEEDNERSDKLSKTVTTVSNLLGTYKSDLNMREYFAEKLNRKSSNYLNNTLNEKKCESSLKSAEVHNESSSASEETMILNKKRKKSQKALKVSKRLKLEKCATKLKSCLKGRNGSQKKNVSFCEEISFNIFDSDNNVMCEESIEIELKSKENDSDEELDFNSVDSGVYSDASKSSVSPENEMLSEESIENSIAKNKTLNQNADSHDLENEETSCYSNIASENDSDMLLIEKPCKSKNKKKKKKRAQEIKNMDAADDDCFQSVLPKNITSNYSIWIESQRQALKMNVYKKMMQKILKHPILKTTNLLSIKGYGNWGF